MIDNKFFLTDTALQEQYGEFWDAKAEALLEDVDNTYITTMKAVKDSDAAEQQAAQMNFFTEVAPKYVEQAEAIVENAEKQCPDVNLPAVSNLKGFAQKMAENITYATNLKNNQPQQ